MNSNSDEKISRPGPVDKSSVALAAPKSLPTPVATQPEAESRPVPPTMVLRSLIRGGGGS